MFRNRSTRTRIHFCVTTEATRSNTPRTMTVLEGKTLEFFRSTTSTKNFRRKSEFLDNRRRGNTVEGSTRRSFLGNRHSGQNGGRNQSFKELQSGVPTFYLCLFQIPK